MGSTITKLSDEFKLLFISVRNCEIKILISSVQMVILRLRATVSVFHKFTLLTQGDEENRTRQNTVIYYV